MSFHEDRNQMSLYNPASPPEHASRNRQRDGSEVAAAGAGTGLGGNPTKVLDFARMIGMDLTHDSEYIWIADEMVMESQARATDGRRALVSFSWVGTA